MSEADPGAVPVVECLAPKTGQVLAVLRNEPIAPELVEVVPGPAVVSKDDQAAAAAGKAEFIARFQQGAMPGEIPEKSVSGRDGKLGIAHLLREAGLVASTSEAFRMIKQGAVKIDGSKISDRGLEIEAGTRQVYQVGKRKFARVAVT